MHYCCNTFRDRIDNGTIARWSAHTRPPLRANRQAVYTFKGVDIIYCPFCGVKLIGRGKGKRRKGEEDE